MKTGLPFMNYNDIFDYIGQYIDKYFERVHYEHEIAEYMDDFYDFMDKQLRWVGEYYDYYEFDFIPSHKHDVDNYLAWRFENRTIPWMEDKELYG